MSDIEHVRVRDTRALSRAVGRFVPILTLLLALGCGDGPTAPRSPTAAPTRIPSPTPTPAPTVSVEGRWTGTFRGFSLGCSGNANVAASATLSQLGSTVGGTVSAGCAFHGSVSGTIVGQNVYLRTLGSPSLTLAGSGSSTAMELKVSGGFLAPNGDLNLRK
jgi:hypothetical protein